MKRRDLLKLTGAAGGFALVPTLVKAGAVGLTSATTTSSLPSGIQPTLPQNQSLLDRIARQEALTIQQFIYLWTENAPNLPGVPMAAGLPLNEMPSLEWQLKLIPILTELVVNLLASIGAQLGPARASSLSSQQQQLDGIRSNTASAQAAYTQLVGAYAGIAPLSASTAAQLAQIQQQLQSGLQQLASFNSQLVPLIQQSMASAEGLGVFSTADVSRYDALFVTIPRPDSAEFIHDDNFFAWLRVGGANPMLLQRVDALPAKFPLTDAQYQQVMGEGDNLSAALASNRLYLLDYVELGAMAPAGPTSKLLTGAAYDFAPMALFAVPQGAASLVPVAIQCGQNPATTAIFLRADSTDAANYWSWQMAKSAVQTADLSYHEMFVHLGHTHLVSEGFAVATHRQLAPCHPLNVLLVPHFEGNLSINSLAAIAIMAPLTFGDLVLGSPIQASQESARDARLGFDFYANMPPADFKARGVDDVAALPDYPYRDDALLLWAAITQWVEDYIAIYYHSDQDVIADSELAAWTNELIYLGKIKGFRPIISRSQLVEVVSMIIFIASAQHAAVNYPQKTLMSYPPAYPGSSAAPAPDQATGRTPTDWENMLPDTLSAIAQVGFLQLLGSLSYSLLGDYRSNTFPYLPVMSDPRITSAGGPLLRFQAALQDIEKIIAARNQQRTRPYPYLLPSKITASTNI